MPSYESAVTALRAAAAVTTVAAAYAGCAGPATTHSLATTTTAPPAATAPMVVDGPSTARSGNVETHSVYCIPADTTPFDLQHAKHWREVAIDGTGDNLAQHDPCPSGPIVAGD